MSQQKNNQPQSNLQAVQGTNNVHLNICSDSDVMENS